MAPPAIGTLYPAELNSFKTTLRLNPPKYSLYQTPNFSVAGRSATFQSIFENVNSVGLQLNWQPYNKLTLILQPGFGRFYNEIPIPAQGYFGHIGTGLSYQVNDWLMLQANARYIHASSALSPGFYPESNVGGSAIFRIFDWLGVAVGVNYVYINGTWQQVFYVSPVFPFFSKKKKKKEKDIPDFWY